MFIERNYGKEKRAPEERHMITMPLLRSSIYSDFYCCYKHIAPGAIAKYLNHEEP